MSCLVFGFDTELAAWAASRIPHMRGGTFGPCRSIGVMRGRDPDDMSAPMQAVVVFHDYIEGVKTCQVSVASSTPMWARRDVIRGILSYPFEQLGVNLIWSAMPHENHKVIAFNEHLGFRRDSVLRHRFGWKKHAVVASMTVSEYNKVWKYGQVRAFATHPA